MPSLRSEVSICNQALTRLGQDRILSLQENNPKAVWMTENYPALRDAVLQEAHWTFTKVRHRSETSTKNEWGQMVHSIPLGWTKVFAVYDSPMGLNGLNVEWQVEDHQVLSNRAVLWMRGIKLVTDVKVFSELFTQALAARIAAESCIAFTENRKLQADMWNLYEKLITEASAHDGQQASPEKVRKGRLTQRRG